MTVAVLILIGLVAGVLAATLGIGGGLVYVPALVTLFSLGQQEAQGTSLVVIVPTALLAALVHSRSGRVDWRQAAAIGFGGIAGGVGGATVALAIDPTLLCRMFAVFLVLVALRMLRRGTNAGAAA